MSIIVIVNGIDNYAEPSERSNLRRQAVVRSFPGSVVAIYDCFRGPADFAEHFGTQARRVLEDLERVAGVASAANRGVYPDPIFFLAYNTGATLVKKVLCLAQASSQHKWLAASTVRCHFIESLPYRDPQQWGNYFWRLRLVGRLAPWTEPHDEQDPRLGVGAVLADTERNFVPYAHASGIREYNPHSGAEAFRNDEGKNPWDRLGRIVGNTFANQMPVVFENMRRTLTRHRLVKHGGPNIDRQLALEVAIWTGDVHTVNLYLSVSNPYISLLVPDELGNTVVHLAAERNDLAMLQALHDNRREDFMRALAMPNSAGLLPVQVLYGTVHHVDDEFDRYSGGLWLMHTNMSHTLPSGEGVGGAGMLWRPLQLAVTGGNVEALRHLTRDVADIFEGQEGYSAFELAARYGNRDMLRFLVDTLLEKIARIPGPRHNCYPGFTGSQITKYSVRAAQSAIDANNVDVASYIITEILESDAATRRPANLNHRDFMQRAVRAGHLDMVKALMILHVPLRLSPAGGDLNGFEHDDENEVVDLAVAGNHVDVLQYLLDLGLECHISRRHKRRSSIQYAAQLGHLGCLSLLLRRSSTQQIRHVDARGWTARDSAAAHHQLEAMRLLITLDRADLAAIALRMSRPLGVVDEPDVVKPWRDRETLLRCVHSSVRGKAARHKMVTFMFENGWSAAGGFPDDDDADADDNADIHDDLRELFRRYAYRQRVDEEDQANNYGRDDDVETDEENSDVEEDNDDSNDDSPKE